MLGRCLITSASPTTATSRDSTLISHPAVLMRSPPSPKKFMGRESARRRAWISRAPYCSPEASPAEMRMVGMRKQTIVPASRSKAESLKHKGHEVHKEYNKCEGKETLSKFLV